MTPDISNGPNGPTGETITTPDGQQYFLFGKNRIRITEHFASSGKQLGTLLEELIVAKSKEKPIKTA